MAFKLAQYKCQDFRQNLNQLSLKIMFSFRIPNPIEAQLKFLIISCERITILQTDSNLGIVLRTCHKACRRSLIWRDRPPSRSQSWPWTPCPRQPCPPPLGRGRLHPPLRHRRLLQVRPPAGRTSCVFYLGWIGEPDNPIQVHAMTCSS